MKIKFGLTILESAKLKHFSYLKTHHEHRLNSHQQGDFVPFDKPDLINLLHIDLPIVFLKAGHLDRFGLLFQEY